MMRETLSIAALLLAGACAPQRASEESYSYKCTDPVDGHAFVLETGKITNKVTDLFGEDYGYFSENGRAHRISQSWMWQHCQIPASVLKQAQK